MIDARSRTRLPPVTACDYTWTHVTAHDWCTWLHMAPLQEVEQAALRLQQELVQAESRAEAAEARAEQASPPHHSSRPIPSYPNHTATHPIPLYPLLPSSVPPPYHPISSRSLISTHLPRLSKPSPRPAKPATRGWMRIPSW